MEFGSAACVGLGEGERYEAGLVATLQAHQDGLLALLARVAERLLDLGRLSHGPARDLENHVAGLDALLRSRAVGIDLHDGDALVTGALDRLRRSQRQAEARPLLGLVAGVGLGRLVAR